MLNAELTRNTETFTAMDPFCKLSTADGSQKFETKVKDGAGKKPVWNETFTFLIDGQTKGLQVDVYDDDPSADDLIGSVEIPTSNFCFGEDGLANNQFTLLHK